MHPQTQPKATLDAVDYDRLTEIAVLNPSITLLATAPSLEFLLSKDTNVEQHLVHLRGSRLIRIPLGRTLAMLRLLGGIFRLRLPDEFEFCDVEIRTAGEKVAVYADGTFLRKLAGPSQMIPLTGNEYYMLIKAPGRDLHDWIAKNFKTGAGLRTKTSNLSARRRAA
jgi:hypothetical protein